MGRWEELCLCLWTSSLWGEEIGNRRLKSAHLNDGSKNREDELRFLFEGMEGGCEGTGWREDGEEGRRRRPTFESSKISLKGASEVSLLFTERVQDNSKLTFILAAPWLDMVLEKGRDAGRLGEGRAGKGGNLDFELTSF